MQQICNDVRRYKVKSTKISFWLRIIPSWQCGHRVDGFMLQAVNIYLSTYLAIALVLIVLEVITFYCEIIFNTSNIIVKKVGIK